MAEAVVTCGLWVDEWMHYGDFIGKTGSDVELDFSNITRDTRDSEQSVGKSLTSFLRKLGA